MLRIETITLTNASHVKQKKIEFLEKLFLEKDNGEHAARKRMKKVEKEKQELSESYAAYKN